MNTNWEKITSTGLKHEHYQADALIVYCVDCRGKKALEEFISKNKFQYYDLVMIPGGAKAIAGQNEAERIVIVNYIKKLIELHKAKRVILATHIDCGACGGNSAFNNDPEKERQTHEQWLKAAQYFLSRLFPSISSEIYFVDFEGIWQII